MCARQVSRIATHDKRRAAGCIRLESIIIESFSRSSVGGGGDHEEEEDGEALGSMIGASAC